MSAKINGWFHDAKIQLNGCMVKWLNGWTFDYFLALKGRNLSAMGETHPYKHDTSRRLPIIQYSPHVKHQAQHNDGQKVGQNIMKGASF